MKHKVSPRQPCCTGQSYPQSQVQYKLGPERLTRLGNSNVLRMPVEVFFCYLLVYWYAQYPQRNDKKVESLSGNKKNSNFTMIQGMVLSYCALNTMKIGCPFIKYIRQYHSKSFSYVLLLQSRNKKMGGQKTRIFKIFKIISD